MAAAVLCVAATVAGTAVPAHATSAAPGHKQAGAWGSGTLTNAELRDLVSQMTLSEETGMVHGGSDSNCATTLPEGCVGQAGIVVGVPRLGIPPLRMTDGPAGVRLSHVETAMPAPVGLAATFDRNAAQTFGSTVGAAGRATGADVWLAPMINEVNFPTGGRNFETLGEDPYLAGQLVAKEVKGAQSQGLITELKHYIENDFENGRGSTSVAIDDQTLHETELLAFQAGIQAGAGSVMCSYNRINNYYGCGNSNTLISILRQQLAFQGFVQSDWGAVHQSYNLLEGTDIEEPRPNHFSDSTLADAVTNGTPAVPATADYPAEPAISGAKWKHALDNAVFHILWTMNQDGLLEGTQYGSHYNASDPQPYVPPRPDLASLQAPDAAAARVIAEQSATLLKNDGHALPLTPGDFSPAGGGVVVMGPTAVAPYTGGGGSAHVTPYDPVVSPLTALQQAVGNGGKLTYVPGYDLDGTVTPSSALSAPDPANDLYSMWTLKPEDAAFTGQNGLLRQQTTTDPVPSGSTPALASGPAVAPDQLDQTVDYTGSDTLPANTGWRWTGVLTAPGNPGGTDWQLHVFVKGQQSSQLFVDGLTVGSRRTPGDDKISIGAYPAAPGSSYAGLAETPGMQGFGGAQPARSHDPAHPTLEQSSYSVTLAPGQQLHLDLRLITGDTPAQIQLRWVPPDSQSTSIAQAVDAASSAHTAVIFAYDEGTEGRDRGGSDQVAGLQLPGYQDQLISAVAAANPNTVVVLNTGDPVIIPWANKVKSILEMWYPGQSGGYATADVLTGKADPGGHLPVTFPADATKTPMYDPNCTDTSPTGNCPLYPGVVKDSAFVPGEMATYRTITGMQVNGIYEGYRWYDKNQVAPLFPFGYGLSYTSFAYHGLQVKPLKDGGLRVSFDVRNTGRIAGSEVPQVYIGPSPNLPPSIQQAVNKLVQFQRVTLKPGQAQHLKLEVTKQELSSWSTADQAWTEGTGTRTLWVGSSSRDPQLTTTVVVGSRH